MLFRSRATASSEGNEDSLREKLESEIRAELEKEFKSEGKSKSSGKSKSKSQPKKTQSKPKSKPKTGGLFGAKRPQKTYEGEPGGKADWFLEEALDTVYDPHGTGKSVKGATILARSSDGNVRVRDVVRAYALQDQGFDTVEANQRLGFADDERVFLAAAEMLRQLDISEVRLLTNNPRKVKQLEEYGIKVAERVEHVFASNEHNERYLAVKAEKSGHLF